MAKDESSITNQPDGSLEISFPRLDKKKRDDLGAALQSRLQEAQGQRGELDEHLVEWNNDYEMLTEPRDWPWEDASNQFVPLIPDRTDTLVSRIAQQSFQPRLYLCRGLTPDAAKEQALVERYYNAELLRHGWLEPHYDLIQNAAVDGTAIMEVLWEKVERTLLIEVDVPVMDEVTGLQSIHPVTGQLQTRKELQPKTYTEYDDARLTPIKLRDFIMAPAYAPDIERAYMVGRAHYFTKDELLERAESGDFWQDAVDFVIKGKGPQDEQAADPSAETETLSAGGQIDVSSEATANPDIGEYTGTFKVWRLHCSAYDLNGDDKSEENVFWLHESTGKLLGAGPYKYHHGKRPFVKLCLMPRRGVFYGYSVPERLRSSQIQLNANRNHRNDLLDLLLDPIMYRTAGAQLLTEDQPRGPGSEWLVSTKDDIGYLPGPQINPQSYTEETIVRQEADDLLGLTAPMPQGGGARDTKAKAQMMGALMTVRMQLMAKRVLFAFKEILWHIHRLKIQYGPDVDRVPAISQGKAVTLEVPKRTLLLDFELEVNGLLNPVEANTRRQEKMFRYTLLMENPLVQGHLDRVYHITRDLLEDFDDPDVEAMIGTTEQAGQQQQQMQQQQAQQRQLESLAMLTHMKQAQQHGNAPPGAGGKRPQKRKASMGGMPPGAPQTE